MFDYPLDFAYGRRLDNIDYERMGVLDIWYVRNTIILLTSFEMEIKGYFSRPDHKYCYERVYHKFSTYVHDCLMNKEFKYDDGLDDDAREQNKAEGMIGFDLDDACFYKKDILDNISNNIKTFVDVELLEEFLSGCSNHVIPIVYIFPEKTTSNKEDRVDQRVPEKKLEDISDSTSPVSRSGLLLDGPNVSETKVIINDPVTEQIDVATNDKKYQYSFVKRGRSWDIQFGEYILRDVKHLTGMDYIKILLQKPRNEIGVIDIQAMMNPDANLSTKAKKRRDVLIDHKDEEEPLHSRRSDSAILEGGSNFNKFEELSDDFGDDDEDQIENDEPTEAFKKALAGLSGDNRKRVEILYKQIDESKAKLEEAKDNNDNLEASRLMSLINIMNDDMYNIIYDRSDDPELNKNRKKVYKSIEDARNNIKSEEIAYGYDDTPIYTYLKKYIETGYTCKYNPLADDPISWIF